MAGELSPEDLKYRHVFFSFLLTEGLARFTQAILEGKQPQLPADKPIQAHYIHFVKEEIAGKQTEELEVVRRALHDYQELMSEPDYTDEDYSRADFTLEDH